MIEFHISKTSEEDVRKFLRDNYVQFESAFEKMSEETDYSHKLYSSSSRFELWNGEDLIGLLCVYFNKDLKQAYIPYICVSKDYKGKGLGSILINALIENIKNVHDYVSFIALEVLITNISAQGFYNKFSFNEYSRNEYKIQMRKEFK